MAAQAYAVEPKPRYAITFGAVLKAGEDRAAYEKLVKEQYKQYKPIAEHEIFLVQELADALWRLKRARSMEAQADTIDQLDKVARYIAHIERTYHRAYKELKKINEERNKSTGLKYDIHSSYYHDPDWILLPPEKPKVQNRPWHHPEQNEPNRS